MLNGSFTLCETLCIFRRAFNTCTDAVSTVFVKLARTVLQHKKYMVCSTMYILNFKEVLVQSLGDLLKSE